MKKTFQPTYIIVLVSIILTSVQPSYATQLCAELFSIEQITSIQEHYSPETKKLIVLLEERLEASDLEMMSHRWDAIDKNIQRNRLTWENDIAKIADNKKLSEAVKKINGYRLGPSNSFRAEPAETFARWKNADRLLLDLSKTDQFISIDSFRRINKIIAKENNKINGPGVIRSREYWDDFIIDPKNPSFLAFKAVEVEHGINDLVHWYQKNKNIVHPIVLATQFTQRFLTIHPFVDANGRTARLFADRILIMNGYPPPALLSGLSMRSFKENDTSLRSAINAYTAGIERSIEILENQYESYNR